MQDQLGANLSLFRALVLLFIILRHISALFRFFFKRIFLCGIGEMFLCSFLIVQAPLFWPGVSRVCPVFCRVRHFRQTVFHSTLFRGLRWQDIFFIP